MLKEVIKMSELEYQSKTGKLSLAHLKRKKKPLAQVTHEPTDRELAELAKLSAPRTLAPLIAKKAPSVIKLKPLNLIHNESAATMVGMQSLKTDAATVQVNPSMVGLGAKEIDEDSILKEYNSGHKASKVPNASYRVSPRKGIDMRVGEEDLLNSGDFDVSASLSPGKFDRQLEKIMNDQQKRN